MPVLESLSFSLSPLELAFCVVALLFAYGLRGSTGFGGALGMAMLVVVIPIKVVVPAWTLLSIASSIAILGHDRRRIAWRELLPFLPWCMVGIAIGLYIFTTLDPKTLANSLGVIVFVYAAYALWSTYQPESGWRVPERLLGAVAGTVSGAVGTIFGTMATPFFVMYLEARKLAKQAFRATMSAMLLALALVRGIGYWAVGEFTQDSLVVFAAAFPVMLIGIYAGNRIHLHISELTFKRIVGATLMACSVPLLLK
ncbi:MAG TPA: sulfite exporter TauE/SafE family protein [Burkholderiales bacterium]|nr:sulfite exporter TauE/SafE family protein [Burkholderiales bacterium]